ncbi:MAG: hypothetical protein JXB48_23655, partial [Candidatus Latescibacteria bacterium]|nr:hypothetical protein [Candidatus Latescibacterota bacterium]
MKKLIGITFVLLFAVSSLYAADFAPTPMVISAPSTVYYEFDNSELTIPIQITGTPANAMLL